MRSRMRFTKAKLQGIMYLKSIQKLIESFIHHFSIIFEKQDSMEMGL